MLSAVGVNAREQRRMFLRTANIRKMQAHILYRVKASGEAEVLNRISVDRQSREGE
jgi:hypothetical protein